MEFLHSIGFDALSLTLESASWVLVVIVVRSQDLLDQKYLAMEEARELLDNDRNLFEALKDAWATKSFSQVQCFGG